MFVINSRKIFFTISAIIIIVSCIAMVKPGFNLGIDFKGGTIIEVSYPRLGVETMTARPSPETVKEKLDTLSLGAYSLRPSGDNDYVLRTRELTQEEKTVVIGVLSLNKAEVKRLNSIGPTVGGELRSKAFIAIALVILGIVLFVTFAFRKVSEPVASWKYGLATIIALVHDVIIPTGIYILFSKFYSGGQIDVLFVTAILAILGYSVHDTIVVFDRVREHLRTNRERRVKESFDVTVGKSVSETFGRSINTSLTIFLVLIALYFIGGETTRNFAFVLIVGIIAGTYSSIFIASPILVTLEKLQARRALALKK